MKSVLLQIGKVSIYGYGTMIALGMILCVAFACRRAKKNYNIDPDMMFNVAFIGIIAGIVGSKLTYWIVNIKEVIADPSSMLDLGGGFVIYGGLIAGILAAVVYLKKIKKTTVLDKLDLAVPSIAMAQGFGRIGCFMAGCCYGREAAEGAWYALHFPVDSLAPAGVGLIPTQLISAGLDFLLFLFLWFWSDRESFRGELIAFYMALYSVGRFFVEYLRDDPRGTVGVFSTSQFIAIFMLAAAVALWLVMRKLNLPSLYETAHGTEDGEDGGEPEKALSDPSQPEVLETVEPDDTLIIVKEETETVEAEEAETIEAETPEMTVVSDEQSKE